MLSSIKRFFQRLFRGWDDSETWDVSDAFLRWFLPRIKRYKAISLAYPPKYTEKEWDALLGYLTSETEAVLYEFAHEEKLSIDEVENMFRRREKLLEQIFKHIDELYW